jgi:[acyl-carrier-protein] S-malonyltransferase
MKAAIFPGQGSQYIGMGKALWDSFPLVRQRFEEASDILGCNLFDVVCAGPEDLLSQTQWAQPAIFTLSASMADLLAEKGHRFDYMAGHSLGEYSALYAAGVMTFAQAMVCIQTRCQAMTKITHGGMVAVIGAPAEQLAALLLDFQRDIELANDNTPEQVVVSGQLDALNSFSQRAKAAGYRCIPLKVSGPFHTSFMAPAQPFLENVLAPILFSPPSCPVLTNVSAQAQVQPEVLKAHLVKQIVSPVRWKDTQLELVRLGVTDMIEVGPGKVLLGLAKKTIPPITVSLSDTPGFFEALSSQSDTPAFALSI